MSMLLTADWHLTDYASEDYRWEVFPKLRAAAKTHKTRTIYILGDLTDRKDRHPASLVNRLLEELRRLLQLGLRVEILLGNHDFPLSGEPYWSALNYAFGENSGLRVIAKPEISHGLLLLPHSREPTKDWGGLDLTSSRTVLMHQTLTGAKGANGYELHGSILPSLGKGLTIYSGDVHVPQKIGPVTYVGAPHPVAFGDTHACRFLALDARGKATEVPLTSIRKDIVNISCADDLLERMWHRYSPGDQICIRATIPISQIQYWPAEEQAIREKAAHGGVLIGWVDVAVDGGAHTPGTQPQGAETTAPDAVLGAFAEAEGLDGPVLAKGQELLRKTGGP